MARIWNESELKSMPEWEEIIGGWSYGEHDYCICDDMVGKEITESFKSTYNVLDYMIAKEPKEEVISDNEILQSSVNAYTDGEKIIHKPNNMETNDVILSNGTVLEVGGTITSKHWDKGEYVTITAIGKEFFLASHQNRNKGEMPYVIDADYWLPYTPPTPQKDWKTFLIEFSDFKCIGMYLSKEDAWNLNKGVISITEVKLNIEEVK